MKRISMLIVAFVLFAIPAWAIYQSSTFGNRSGVATGGASLLVYWDGGDSAGTETQLNTYQENSGTITSTNSDFTPTGYGGSGHSCYVDADGVAYFQCTDGTSIDLDNGQIEFTYKRRDTPDSYAVLFQLGSGASDFVLRFYAAISEVIQFRYGGNRFDWDVSAIPFTLNTWYTWKVTWDPLGSNNPRLWIDDNEIMGGSWTTGSDYGAKPSLGTVTMRLMDDSTGTYNAMAEIDEFKIYPDVQ